MKSSGYIFNLKKYAIHDGPGIRTTVFFQGCPMRCWWCHNPESQESLPGEKFSVVQHSCLRQFSRPIPYRTVWQVTVEELMSEIRKDLIFYEESGGGVTFSGGEPLLQLEFLKDLLRSCKVENLHTAVDTCGYASWRFFQDVQTLVDLFLFDLKFIDDQQHRRYTGVSNQTILENLQELSEMKQNIVIRIPLIPHITDTVENLEQIAGYLSQFPVIRRIDLLPYNPMGEQKYKKLNKIQKITNLKHQSRKELEEIKSLFTSRSFEVMIGG
jgi:pyruvate formate lyase activating enzyme